MKREEITRWIISELSWLDLPVWLENEPPIEGDRVEAYVLPAGQKSLVQLTIVCAGDSRTSGEPAITGDILAQHFGGELVMLSDGSAAVTFQV